MKPSVNIYTIISHKKYMPYINFVQTTEIFTG